MTTVLAPRADSLAAAAQPWTPAPITATSTPTLAPRIRPATLVGRLLDA
jgi:hypothetical protein